MRISRFSTTLFILTCVTLSAASPKARAAIEAVTISTEDKFPAPRWMRGTGDMPKLNQKSAHGTDAVVSELAAVKAAQLQGDFESCLKKIPGVRAKAKSLQAWLAVTEIDCGARAKPSATNANRLAQSLARVEANPAWALKGPQTTLLRSAIVEGYSALLDQDLKTNRARAWKSIETFQEYLGYMDAKSKAHLWRTAGELAFLEQKPEAARDLVRRSLREVDSPEGRERLSTIEAAISTASGAPATPAPVKTRANEAPVFEAPKEELELVDRVTVSLKNGDLVAAADDAVKIVVNYPGSQRAKWASDRVLDVYASLIEKTDPKYLLLRERILKLMEKADSERMYEWAKSIFARGQYEDAFSLVSRAIKGTTGSRSTAALDLGARAALASEKFSDAIEYSAELANRSAGTKDSREALLRMGLIEFRLGRFADAMANFEKVIAIPQNENLELIARYWTWRSLQKLGSDQAGAAADELMKRFPFSYYGLRARYERDGNTLEWKTEKTKVESRIWLTATEHLAWERMQMLLRAGWLEEAQAELRTLPQPLKADDKAVRGLLWAAAGQYSIASKLVNDAWDEKKDLRNTPFVAAAFPTDFDTWITDQANQQKLDPYLVKGLIKQESGYDAKAISPSNAIGLMQMIPPTAKEIANDLKMGPLQIPDDLFQPKRNIQLGTRYLGSLITKYRGNVPLALAAYNAGPGRIDRWLRSRPSLKDLPTSHTSSADAELWIDEVPYAETCFYVKAILRNILIYKMLDKGRVEVTDPVWSFQ